LAIGAPRLIDIAGCSAISLEKLFFFNIKSQSRYHPSRRKPCRWRLIPHPASGALIPEVIDR
jgi:hypothetical protein